MCCLLRCVLCAVLSPQVMGSEGSWLLALPDPCLLLVLQCFAADDYRSLIHAARAHSRLHQAAVVALRSITASVRHQQQMEGVIAYVGKHSQHVNSRGQSPRSIVPPPATPTAAAQLHAA